MFGMVQGYVTEPWRDQAVPVAVRGLVRPHERGLVVVDGELLGHRRVHLRHARLMTAQHNGHNG